MVGKGRTPCCDKTQVKKGPWSPSEDLRLISFIQKYGHDNWRSLPRQAGMLRCGKSCRLRWINYLRPDLKRGNFTKEEETALINLHQVWGNRWSKIASHFPGRTDNEIKNVWNTHLRKRVAKSKKFFADNHSKELSTITSCSSASSSSGASFQLSSGEPDVRGAVKFEHHSGHGSNVAENLNDHELPNSATLKERLDQNSPTQVTNEIRVDDDAKGSKATPTISSSFSSRDSSVGSSSNLQGGISKPNDLVFDFTEYYEPQIANNAEFEIPLEPDYDFWSILDEVDYDPLARYQSNNEVTEPLLPQVDEVYQSSNLGLVENGKWLSYLESELGLEETIKTTTEINDPDVVMKDATEQ